MVAACFAAIEEGVFYQDDFVAFVVDRMGGYGCHPVLMETLKLVPEMLFGDERILMGELSARVREAPRGHYAVVQRQHVEGGLSFVLLTSDGTGRLAQGGRFDTYDQMPDGQKAMEVMVGYEIYLCRKKVERDIQIKADRAALVKYGFAIGMEFKHFKNLQVVGQSKPFSSGVIDAIDAENGEISLVLRRRGSRRRWGAFRGAQRLAEMVGLAEENTPQVETLVFGASMNAGQTGGGEPEQKDSEN
jgi:hypothetical protein